VRHVYGGHDRVLRQTVIAWRRDMSWRSHVLKDDDPAKGFDNWRKCIRIRLLVVATLSTYGACT
jgi:hypothetical protein